MKLQNTTWKKITTRKWNQKKVVDSKSRSVARKIKKLSFYINNNFFYILPEIWLPNLWQFLVTYLFYT